LNPFNRDLRLGKGTGEYQHLALSAYAVLAVEHDCHSYPMFHVAKALAEMAGGRDSRATAQIRARSPVWRRAMDEGGSAS
jgi:hypothetical protein